MEHPKYVEVTILILIDGFLQYNNKATLLSLIDEVTILILIDGFLQYENVKSLYPEDDCHNPYFNRWFSAMKRNERNDPWFRPVTILILIDGFLQSKRKILFFLLV